MWALGALVYSINDFDDTSRVVLGKPSQQGRMTRGGWMDEPVAPVALTHLEVHHPPRELHLTRATVQLRALLVQPSESREKSVATQVW